ncbi:MAG: hypothetical protein VB120_05000 [Lachnospiraceae bacterium]|nr:hypothetical protein [Lachnospiraceae bacterium]
MTWGEIKLAALQRMFAVSGEEIVYDDVTLPYLKSMASAANEALNLLSTAGKYIVKSIDITQSGEEASSPPIKKYSLRDLCSDFYSLKENHVYFKDDENYYRTRDFSLEANDIFVLPSDKQGTWTLYYNAYTTSVDKNTPDNFELALDDEVAVLIPLYIASQLYKDDDFAQSIQFRNEFELGRELLLYGRTEDKGKEAFENINGWY